MSCSTIAKYCGFAIASVLTTTHAAELPPPADVRCFLVGALYATNKDTSEKILGHEIEFYYLALLKEFSIQELETSLIKEDVLLTTAVYDSELRRCGRVIVEKNKTILEMLGDVEKRGKLTGEKSPKRFGEVAATD